MTRARVVVITLMLLAVVAAGFVLHRSQEDARDEPQIFYPCGKDQPEAAVTIPPDQPDGTFTVNALCEDSDSPSGGAGP